MDGDPCVGDKSIDAEAREEEAVKIRRRRMVSSQVSTKTVPLLAEQVEKEVDEVEAPIE